MLITTKFNLPCIDYWCANLWRLTKAPLGYAMILGFFLFNSATAHAIPVRVDSIFLQSGGSGNTLTAEAFFDTAPLTGIGIEFAQIDAFTLQFSDLGLRSAVIDPPSDNFIASFVDGEFSRIGINGAVLLTPRVVFNDVFSFSTDNLGRLIVNFRISGRRNYALVSSSDPIPLPQTTVPAPGALALFGIGLSGLVLARRRRNAA